MMSPEDLDLLRDPRISLPSYGYVLDQSSGKLAKYDPTAITRDMQNGILNYFSKKERHPVTGEVLWLCLLAYRQGGKSLTTALCMYPEIMYSDGRYAVTICDKSERANTLHQRIQYAHSRWPEELRVPQRNTRESLKLEFTSGAGIHVMSGGSHAGGVGHSIDILHMSEVPLHPSAETEWQFMSPALVNRLDSMAVWESTPYDMAEASSEFFKDVYFRAKSKIGRWTSLFYPYFDGLLNVRPVEDGYRETNEELRLIERYGKQGLSRENLAFRRYMMDGELRRNPTSFEYFYPSNDQDPWLVTSNSLIPSRAIERQVPHIRAPLRVTDDGVSVYLEPNPNAQYVCGIDPAGFGQDHHAFHIFEVWEGHWEQAAVFGRSMNPFDFYEVCTKHMHIYNNARACPERNGVGMGLLAHLNARGYKNIHHDAHYKPGAARHAHDKILDVLIDALLDEMVIHDEDTMSSLQTYKGDRLLQRSPAATILHPSDPRRRDRDHWDKVSAAGMVALAAQAMPRRRRPAPPVEPKPSSEWDFDTWEKYRLATQPKKNTSLVKMRRR